MLSESVWLAIIAVSSPVLVGLAKTVLDAKKVKQDAALATVQEINKRNEFLTLENDKLRDHHEKMMLMWHEKFESLRAKYDAEREKVIRLETRHELRKLLKSEDTTVPAEVEHELDFMQEFQAVVDSVVFTDPRGNVVGMNEKAKVVFGYVGRVPIGLALCDLVTQEYKQRCSKALEVVRHGADISVIGETEPIMGVSSQGQTFEMEMSITPFITKSLMYFAAVIRLGHEMKMIGIGKPRLPMRLTE